MSKWTFESGEWPPRHYKGVPAMALWPGILDLAGQLKVQLTTARVDYIFDACAAKIDDSPSEGLEAIRKAIKSISGIEEQLGISNRECSKTRVMTY